MVEPPGRSEGAVHGGSSTARRRASGGAKSGHVGMARLAGTATHSSERDMLTDLGESRVHRIRAETESSVLGAVRRDICRLMEQWGLAPMAYGVCLVVTELLSNVRKHAGGGESDLLLRHSRGRLWVMVGDRSHELPAIKDPDITETSGRGLMVVEEYTDQWTVVPTAVGKVVICRFAVPAEPELSGKTRR